MESQMADVTELPILGEKAQIESLRQQLMTAAGLMEKLRKANINVEFQISPNQSGRMQLSNFRAFRVEELG